MNKKYCIILLIMSSLVVISLVGSVSAANLTVNSSGNIQAALNNASSSDVIQIGNGTYTGTGNVNLTVNKNVSITGSGSTIIDVQGRGNVFNIPNGVIVTISNINFINGNLSSVGGGIHNQGILNLNNCNFINNTAGWGGAISNEGKLTVTNCTFTGNTATHDGGALNSNNFLNVTDSTFTSNRALHVAGGIMNWYGTLKVTSSTFTGNNAPLEGSAISNYGPAELHFNRITGNGRYGLYNAANAITNATNNWWGSNTPIVSGSTRDIYRVSGTVIYDPWLFLTVTANPTSTNANSVITLDLTHNSNKDDTSTQGHFPNMPVNLGTNLGTVVSLVYIKNGKVNTTFNRGTATSGTATITTILDNQTRQTNITIDTISPTVTASPVGGNYNTTQTVTLSATDNLDPNPTIYYTVDGSTPTISSTKYISSINISSITTLKYIAVDVAGNQGPVNTEQYILGRVFNINTGKSYSSIQAAIDDPLTIDGDFIVVSNGTYIENIVVNKSLTLLSEGNVTVQTANPSLSVFTIDLQGSGSAIHSFKIIGATCSPGILLTSTHDCYILDNWLTQSNGIVLLNSNYNTIMGNILITGDNSGGISLTNSSHNVIYENNVSRVVDANGIDLMNYSVNNTISWNDIDSNSGYGIYISNHSSALIYRNNIKDNGISIWNSVNIQIYENDITSAWEGGTGISLLNSSAEIHFNRICGKFRYGLKIWNNSTVNATNNWWGNNIVSYIKSTTTPSKSYNIWNKNSTVFYNPWLLLNLNGSVIYVTQNSTSSSEITADLTHNSLGEDTSGSGTIPDGLPVNFTTTLGNITSTATTKRGKATVTLTSSPSSGATTVTASTYNQTVSKAFRKSFSTIQAAISNTLTVNGDVIVVANGTYTENIGVYKNLTIISEGNVTVQASNLSRPIFTINRGGSGSLIQGFVISGAVNSFGILLDGCSNCTIINNTISNNYFGILTNTVKTENNAIMSNNITLNQELGLAISNSDNYVIYGNTITYNEYGGITLLDSSNSIIHTNLIMSNNGPGILISNLNNTIIQNNLIPGNVYGLYMEYCRNCTVYGNLIAQGIWGIYTNSSSVDINFNRIASNVDYELISENGNVNATNNWWGSNDNPVNRGEIVFNGHVDYNPWLVLSIDPASTVNSGGNASITADLTHNNLGQDTSSLGHVIKGIPITFGTSYGTILTPALTFNGKAVAILNLGTTASRTVTVNASLDSQTVSRQMTIAPGSAVLNITSSALNSTTLQPISFTYTVPLNSSVTWISILWKSTYVFYGELQVIIDGNVVSSTEYVNPAFNNWKTSYPEKVFRAILFANNWLPQLGLDPNDIPNFWNETATLYNLTSIQLQFVQNHRMEFIDNLTVNLSYPGVLAPAMTITDPQTNSTINLNFTGNIINRCSQILYMDGSLTTAGYEGVKSFAIATTRVTDSIAQYWADQKNATDINGNLRYPAGAMKAAYGTFFTALMMIYCHDILADTAASEFNVTWSRTHPVAVSVGDDAYQTYLTLECDHSMGMTVIGSLKNITHFNSACSSQISTIEYGIMRNLDFTSQYETISMDVMGSVARDMFYAFWTGTDLELFTKNGYTIMKLVGRDDLLLLYDPETGIMRDINTLNGFCGAYCFHDHITDLSYDFFGGVKNSTIAYMDWAHESVEDFSHDVQWGYEHFNWDKFYHIAWNGVLLIGAGLALTGEIIAIPETLGGSILLMAPTIVTIYMSGNDMIDWIDAPTFKE
jgi:parallel beta-helix repeat protein